MVPSLNLVDVGNGLFQHGYTDICPTARGPYSNTTIVHGCSPSFNRLLLFHCEIGKNEFCRFWQRLLFGCGVQLKASNIPGNLEGSVLVPLSDPLQSAALPKLKHIFHIPTVSLPCPQRGQGGIWVAVVTQLLGGQTDIAAFIAGHHGQTSNYYMPAILFHHQQNLVVPGLERSKESIASFHQGNPFKFMNVHGCSGTTCQHVSHFAFGTVKNGTRRPLLSFSSFLIIHGTRFR